ncbi:MAG: (d)CMP kinase [Mucinivorans sp.]
MTTKRQLIIAIDGYSSCGKSSFAKAIASRLGYVFIDTGAMYRAVTLYAIRRGLLGAELEANLDSVHISFVFNATLGRSEIYLDQENIDLAIRSVEVNNMVSAVASLPAVRHKLVTIQRAMGHRGGVVMDGRDIGTVVFPEADIKIFMTADPVIRAQRRYDELHGAVALADIEKNVRERDAADLSRQESPLRQAADATVLDNSRMTPEDQMIWFFDIFAPILQ